MTIPFSRYVSINSRVIGRQITQGRRLGLRVFLGSVPQLDPSRIYTYKSVSEVRTLGTSLGITNNANFQDLLRVATFYFSYNNQYNTAPQELTVTRVTNPYLSATPDGAAFKAYGGLLTAGSLDAIKLITNGVLAVVLYGNNRQTNITTAAMNFSTDTSFTAVASRISSALNTANNAIGTGSFKFNSTRNRFEFTPADSVLIARGLVEFASGVATGTNIVEVLNFGAAQREVHNGYPGQRYSDTLTRIDSIDSDFGSFIFLPRLVDLSEITALAQRNQSFNIRYMHLQGVTAENYLNIGRRLNGIPAVQGANVEAGVSGTALTLVSTANQEFPEVLPGAILASTNYDNENSTLNYMFQRANLTPLVNDNSYANKLDTVRVNYYGQTKATGAPISFYQRGYMTGQQNLGHVISMNTYANELWFKARLQQLLATLLIQSAKVTANDRGRTQVLAVIQNGVNEAVTNGTISVRTTLNETQKASITQITGKKNAWHQVQNIGYWLNCVFEDRDVNGVTEKVAIYTVVYAKDDLIRKIEGQHDLVGA